MCGVIAAVFCGRKNNIRDRRIYTKYGRKLKQINLYYTNTGSIRYSAKDPKLEVATEVLNHKNIDFIGITDSGVSWNKSIKNKVKHQIRKIKVCVKLAISYVLESKERNQQGGTFYATVGGILGCVVDQG